MKKNFIIVALAIPVFLQAQDPIAKKQYKPQVVISVVGGIQNNQNLKLKAPVYGLEIGVECPLIQTKRSHIRQQFSLIRLEDKMYKSLAAEINPQYKIVAGQIFEIGVGPSLGVLFTKAVEEKRALFSYGLGASVMCQFRKFSFGIESRYACTKKASFKDLEKESTKSVYLNNLRNIVKIGYKLYK
ncbi:MAG: hypothetical protein HYZ15_14680 [Sphingobacteriales bacterium]|nr:hypothetical protein [Sphingobacteriales bacterium]